MQLGEMIARHPVEAGYIEPIRLRQGHTRLVREMREHDKADGSLPNHGLLLSDNGVRVDPVVSPLPCS